jgi:hypothetical protein
VRPTGHSVRRCLLLAVLVAAAAVGAAAAGLQGSAAAAAPSSLALPDMRIFVPTNLISIGVSPGTGHRQLQFTHITADVGAGPFEIDPHYDAQTGISTFTQRLYRSTGQGSWAPARSVPLAAVGTWMPPSDYNFPLTRFTLSRLGPRDSLGSVVAVSPKVDYCITGDTMVNGIPDTPSQTFISPGNCGDPTQPLGWSVGWGDEYDQTDAGQPIDLTGVPNGTYILRATVDPYHVFRESSPANDVTDTTLRISGFQVTVLSQRVVNVPLPRVRIAGPAAGSTVYRGVTLRATASAPSGATVRSVQFLLDGQPIGPALSSAPYSLPWTLQGVAGGHHYLSARVTDADGVMSSAPPVAITVAQGPPVTVRRLHWQRGTLTMEIAGVPKHDSAVAVVKTSQGQHRFTFQSTRLSVRSPRPTAVTLELLASDHHLVASIPLPLTAQPSVLILNPAAHQTVFGITPLTAQAEDAVGVDSVRFFLDGRALGRPIVRAPYSLHWDTRRLKSGSHVLRARVVDALGHTASTSITIVVQNPAPPMTCFVMQRHEGAHGTGVVSVPGFQTAVAGETLLAFVSADGPQGGRQSAVVSGGGVTWRLITRANRSPGDAEVWQAIAPKPVRLSAVSATLTGGGYDVSLDVIAMEAADGTGARAAASGSAGAPAARLRTESATSLIFAVGHDWDQAKARTLPVGWVMLDQWLDSSVGDTFWTQYRNTPTGKAGSSVTVQAPEPHSDHWNLAAVELINSGD